MNKNIYFIGVIAIIAIIGSYFYPKSVTTTVEKTIVGSAVGTTFNTAKVAQINFSPATAAATSTSILNSDDSARWVTDSFSYCSGVGTSKVAYSGGGLANLIFQAATTSTSNPNTVTNTNAVMNITISTTTTGGFSSNATTTATTTGAYGLYPGYQYWSSGSYMTFWSNATNTAACTVGVKYVPS